MATVGQPLDHQIGHSNNKEPDWSSICNNVFDQYLDTTDDIFGLDFQVRRERCSSNGSGDLFNFSAASDQSNQTVGTSPIPAYDHSTAQRVVSSQPKAKEPVDFWTKTLQALERNAAECETRQRKLRAAKSHPDFLSLGGCPSPPAVSSTPSGQPVPAQRHRVRNIAANGREASQAWSQSRDRSQPVIKAVTAPPTTVNPYATIRQCSVSPVKMMNPSRYRPGFMDVWAEYSERSQKNCVRRVPSTRLIPLSPPPSVAAVSGDGFAVFRSPATYRPLPVYEDQIAPLTTTFQQAHIQSPTMSPPFSGTQFTASLPFDTASQKQVCHAAIHAVPVDDTSPFSSQQPDLLARDNVPGLDFEFNSTLDLDSWGGAPPAEPSYCTTLYPLPYSPEAFQHDSAIPSTEFNFDRAGLGISCDPTSSISNASIIAAGASGLLSPVLPQPLNSYGLPTHPPGTAKSTPTTPRHTRRSDSHFRSQSPSPPPSTLTNSHVRRTSRRISRHRRTKSTNSTPRHSQNFDKAGFVNFTPQDSSKILSGVAPSGSAKTKARREKEAVEKRRRLSQAAVKAVVQAGGDLEELRRNGLIVGE